MSPPPQRAIGRDRARGDDGRSATRPGDADALDTSIRVLHVDDEPDLVEAAAIFLERANDAFSVVTETAASDGLDRLGDERVDCVVSDFQMPGMDGLEFLEAVREEHGDLPFILFTGRGSEEVASDAMAAGVTDYLQKETGTDQYTILANRIENVVEQHRTERELDALRRRYELVARASADAFHDWDLGTGDLWWSEGLQGTFGYSREEIENDFAWWEERLHPDDRQRVMETIEGTFEDGREQLEVVHRFRRSNGSYAHVITRGYAVYEGDEPVRVVGALIDVTRRTEREEAIRASERRFRALTESVTDAVVTIDTDSTITYANPATEDLFGYSGEELRGTSLTELMPERLRDRHRDGIARYLRTGDRHLDWTGVELPGLHEDGTEIPLAISFGEFEQDGERVFTGVIRDVSDRAERERELQRQNDRLDEFASVVSHDLRNPLSIAVSRLELACEECDSEHLEVVGRSLDRMDDLVGDLLTLVRAGEITDDVEPLVLADVVETAKMAVDDDAVTVTVEPGLGTIIGQRSYVRGLLENLFRNAVEHSSTSPHSRTREDAVEHGGADVAIRVGPLDAGFYVEDDGPGIPAEEREDVFETGYTTKSDGMGVGLNVVEKIVDAHGWDVSVTDGAVGGARFEITSVETAE